MVMQVSSSVDATLGFLNKIQELGFLTMVPKHQKKNFEKLGLSRFFKQINQERRVFIFTNYLNFSVIILTGMNKNQNITFLILVSEDNKEVLFFERFASKNFLNLIPRIYETLFNVLEIIAVMWICPYERCNQTPFLGRKKNGEFYWCCPSNNVHKKNQQD